VVYGQPTRRAGHDEGGMSKKRIAPPPSIAVSPERAARLCRLLRFLEAGARTRAAILQRLRIDIRTFYRDLELLRDCRITVQLERRRYSLLDDAGEAISRLPLPDPGLTLGEAQILAKGRTQVHKRLKELLREVTG
jgi:hypothetical protein